MGPVVLSDLQKLFLAGSGIWLRPVSLNTSFNRQTCVHYLNSSSVSSCGVPELCRYLRAHIFHSGVHSDHSAIMSPPAMAPALGAAGKEYKRESGTARLLGSGTQSASIVYITG